MSTRWTSSSHWLRDNEPEKYRVVVECGALFTGRWYEPFQVPL